MYMCCMYVDPIQYHFILVRTHGVFVLFYLLFFFFKQKTAYEMRISDWSSDVCSSDLDDEPLPSGKDLDAPPASMAGLHLRKPDARDGPAITALIARCPPLDRNSAYCNLKIGRAHV